MTSKKIIIKSKKTNDSLPFGTKLEAIGRVVKVYNTNRTSSQFDVLTLESQKIIPVTWTRYWPIMEGDAAYVSGEIDERKKLSLIRTPFVTPAEDEESIKIRFRMALGYHNKNIHSIYDEINKSKRESDLSDRLNNLSYVCQKDSDLALQHLVPENLKEETIRLLKWWYKKVVMRRLYLLDLTTYEINGSNYDPIDLYQIILENPYRVSSLSLEKSDSILRILRKPAMPEERRHAEIVKWVNQLSLIKQTYSIKKDILHFHPDFEDKKNILLDFYGLVEDKEKYGLSWIMGLEKRVGSFFKNLSETSVEKLNNDRIKILEDIIGERLNCDKNQKEALIGALEKRVSIITGGPGTGKTTILKILTRYLDHQNLPYILTSFTGKAVMRIKEVIQNPNAIAQTINLLLAKSKKKSNMPEKIAFIIIDEASMVETSLFARFINTYTFEKYKYQVIFLGDINQLSPIGWGCLFAGMIKSGIISTYYLLNNYRSGEGCGIVENAQFLLEGGFFEPRPDFHLCFGKNPLNIINEYQLPRENVRVLSPYRENVDEQNKILQNDYLEKSNAPMYEDGRGHKWLLGDPVMMTKNNYAINIMNGHEGKIVRLDKNSLFVVFNGENNPFEFVYSMVNIKQLLQSYPPSQGNFLNLDDGQEISEKCIISLACNPKNIINYHKRFISTSEAVISNFNAQLKSQDSWDDNSGEEDSSPYPPIDHLAHTYALTIHKSQGSEWDYIIVVVPHRNTSGGFITRNLLYTAITRARKGVFCLGNKQAWLKGIVNVEKEPCQLLSYFINN